MKLLIFLLSILFFNLSFANQIWTNDKLYPMHIEPVSTDTNDGRFFSSQIKFCKWNKGNSQCETLPENLTNLHGFRGTISDWGYFFNRCKNFDHINTLTDVSLIVGTLVAFPSLGFWKTMAAEIGVGFVGGTPYPETPNQVLQVKPNEAEFLGARDEASFETALDLSAQMVYFIMKNERKAPRVPAKYLLALSDIIKVCSQGFKQDYQNRMARKCLGSCHSMPTDYQSPGVSSDIPQQRVLPLMNNYDNDVPIEEISDYLNSVSSQ